MYICFDICIPDSISRPMTGILQYFWTITVAQSRESKFKTHEAALEFQRIEQNCSITILNHNYRTFSVCFWLNLSFDWKKHYDNSLLKNSRNESDNWFPENRKKNLKLKYCNIVRLLSHLIKLLLQYIHSSVHRNFTSLERNKYYAKSKSQSK